MNGAARRRATAPASIGVQPAPAAPERVLIVGINYAPEQTGIAPYTTAAARHFADLGADVTVLAGVPHYPHWSIPADYRGRLAFRETDGPVQLRRLQHYVPKTQSALRRALYELTFAANVAVQRAPRPDVVVAVVPSLLSGLAASRLARRHGIPLVVWIQDLMGRAAEQSGIAGGHRIAGLVTSAEKALLRRASRIAVINDIFRDHVLALGAPAQAVQVVGNWSHVESPKRDRATVRRELGWSDDEIVALHTGNMGLKQGLENVVHSARLAQERACRMRYILMGDGSQRRRLKDLAGDLTHVQFMPPSSREEYPDILAAADVLLVNERGSVSDMSLPSKLTSYFRAGTPVVAAVPSSGGTAIEVRRSGAGLVVNPEDPQELLSQVMAVGGSAEAQRLMRQAAHSYAAEHLSPEVSLVRLARLTGFPAEADRPARHHHGLGHEDHVCHAGCEYVAV